MVGFKFLSFHSFATFFDEWSDENRYQDFGWFDGIHSDDTHFQDNYNTYIQRRGSGGGAVSRPGDRASYTEGLSKWEQMYKTDQNARIVQLGIAGAITIPFAGAAAPSVLATTQEIGATTFITVNIAKNEIVDLAIEGTFRILGDRAIFNPALFSLSSAAYDFTIGTPQFMWVVDKLFKVPPHF